jgi:rare lipoprotein A
MNSTLTDTVDCRLRCRGKLWLAMAMVGWLTGCASAPRQSNASDPRVSLPASGVASYYAPKYEGRRTASGEIYHQNRFTGAHRTLPFGTHVRVVRVSDGRSVMVRINDRGPFARGRLIDVSLAAARQLGLEGLGRALVRVELVEPAATAAVGR